MRVINIMRLFSRVVPGTRPMVVALVVTLVAAGLVVFYQYRAFAALESQTRVVFRQISEQTANDVVFEIRRTLDGPVFDTLLAVTHPELRAGRLDLVAAKYRDGLDDYPQVERFFLWSQETEAIAPGEALFYGRGEGGSPGSIVVGSETGFTSDHELGRTIIDIARRSMRSQVIYAAEDVDGGRQVFLRLYWADARRVAYYAVLGFVVSPSRLPSMFNTLYERSLAALLQRRGGDLQLALRVTDERGTVVYGTAQPQPGAATVTVPMSFYPQARIESRLVAGSMRPDVWRVEVSPPDPSTRLTQGYWPTVASVVLMLVTFGLMVLANRRASELASMQADFIAHVSHQLKTPLSLISAATETVELKHVQRPEKLMQYLGIIRGEAMRLSQLVQRILEFSRLQQPPSLEFEVVDLAQLVRETVEAFERSFAGQQFTFHYEQDGPSPWVRADPAALEQVLANLLDNAVKYSGDARDVRVRVATEGGEASIDVIDDGPGIPRAEQSRIFERFYRGSAASSNVNGFGIGLAIVRELVRAHKGRVEVESTPGAGSTFRMVLPAERADCVDIPSSKDAPRTSEAVT